MTDSKDTEDRKHDAAGKPPSPAAAPKEARSSGRVAFDARGNPIWEWQLETGVYSRDVSTQKLKKLDLGDLSIAESAIQKRPPGLSESTATGKATLPGGGFNPYDTSTRPDPAGNPYDNARSLAGRINEAETRRAPKPVAPVIRKPAAPVRKSPPKKKSMLGRLDQWFKDKRRAKDDGDYE